MLCWPACCCHCCFLPCPAHFCAQAQWFLHVWRLLALLARLLLPLLLPALPCALLCIGVAVSDFLVPACSAGSPAVAIVVACIALHTFVHRHGGLCMFGVCLPCWIACCSHRCCLPCPAHLCAQARWLLRLWCLLALLARLLWPLLLAALPCTFLCTGAAASACLVLACPAGSPAVAIVVASLALRTFVHRRGGYFCVGAVVYARLMPACLAGLPAVATVVACFALRAFVPRKAGRCVFGARCACCQGLWQGACFHGALLLHGAG